MENSPTSTASVIHKRLRASLLGDLLLVIALAAFFRTYNLLILPIFTDESTYLRWAADIWEQKTRAAMLIPILEDGKQPLFMWLAGASNLLFAEPLLAGRVVSALAGVGSALGVYFAGYWLVGRQVGLVAAILYAVVPFNLFFDRMALVEGLLNMGGVWGFSLGAYIATSARGRREAILAGAGLGVALGAAFWTKATAVFMLGFPLLCALFLTRRDRMATSVTGFLVGCGVLGLFVVGLALTPDPLGMVEKAQSFSIPLAQVASLPWDSWRSNGLDYWSWFQAYLPAPLWGLVLATAIWGIVLRRRSALLLLACWAVFTLPPMITALPQAYTTRYVVPGVFPLLILAADFLVWAWYGLLEAAGRWFARGLPVGRQLAGVALMLVVVGSSLQFDLRLVTAPETASLADTDMYHYVVGWPAGYGFMESIALVKQRAAEITGKGQPVIVLSDFPEGLPYDGIRLYMRGMPGVFHYVDMHLARDAEGFIPAWRSHRVPILVIGNEGRADLEAFERGVPQAKRIGFFPKPSGRSSYRVYEVAVEDLTR